MDFWEMWGIRLAGREFHHHMGFTLVSWLDLPTIAVEFALLSPLAAALPPTPREWWVAESYVYAGLFLVMGTAQWWLIGVIVNVRRARRGSA